MFTACRLSSSHTHPFQTLKLHTLVDITSGWAPYRTWVSLLLRVNLEDSTHEISGTRRRQAILDLEGA
jgi:hypothetical protein